MGAYIFTGLLAVSSLSIIARAVGLEEYPVKKGVNCSFYLGDLTSLPFFRASDF